jgi:hypothetical protein
MPKRLIEDLLPLGELNKLKVDAAAKTCSVAIIRGAPAK